VIQLSPPLIADSEEIAEIERVLRLVLTEATDRLTSKPPAGRLPATPRH
jgi:hypothetical protein